MHNPGRRRFAGTRAMLLVALTTFALAMTLHEVPVDFEPATDDEVVACHSRCLELQALMHQRQANGRERSGRMMKHDTARMHFIQTSVMPGLKMGKLPAAYDQHMLFELPGPRDITGPEKKEMDKWADKVKPHPRSAAAKTVEPDEAKQATLLQWLMSLPGRLKLPQPQRGKRGAPPSFTFGAGTKHAEKTLQQVLRIDGNYIRWHLVETGTLGVWFRLTVTKKADMIVMSL